VLRFDDNTAGVSIADRRVDAWGTFFRLAHFPFERHLGDAMIPARTETAAFGRQAPSNLTSSDASLVTRIAGGDQLALRALSARHQIRLYRFLVRTVRDERLAEELLSDVFLAVWRQAAQFERRATVSTWLLAIGRYKALTALRRRSEVELDSEMARTVPDTADDPEISLQKKDLGEVLRRCVAALSPAQGQIIDLVYYQEKSINEVALIVGIPEATVKTRTFYARKRLAELVEAA
jgi:RNA polymerase sigma-70 factor (ECF subfamily)